MVIKVIEVLAQSSKSWEDAAQEAVTTTAETIKDIKSVYVKDLQAIVEGNRIVAYRLNAKISFGVHHEKSPTGARQAAKEMQYAPSNGG
jgi:flavin-binding protein dodecin